MDFSEQQENYIVSFINGGDKWELLMDIIKTPLGFDKSFKKFSYVSKVLKEIKEWAYKYRKRGYEFTSINDITKLWEIFLPRADREKKTKIMEDLIYLIIAYVLPHEKFSYQKIPNPIKYPTMLFPVRLETRFKQNDLLIRIYPDDLMVDAHDDRLTPNELKLLKKFVDSFEEGEKQRDEKQKRDAWRELVNQVGRPRAVYLKGFDQKNDLNQLNENHKRDQNILPTPAIRIRPDHYLAYLYDKKGKLYDAKIGFRVKPNLPLISNFSDEQTAGNSLFDEDARWVADFDVAEQAGMGIRIRLKNPDKDDYFSRIVVVGLNQSKTAEENTEAITQWINSHRYTTDFGFIPYGTATNLTNPETKTNSLTSDDDAETSYNLIFKKGDKGNSHYQYGARLAKALGVPNKMFETVENANKCQPEHDQLLKSALWPALGGHFLFHMIRGVPVFAYNYLWHHFSEYVSARGILPTIRVGKQPYGILPVSSLRAWQASPFDTHPFGKNNREAFSTFYEPFSSILTVLFDRWLDVAKNSNAVPRIGQSDDPDQEMAQVLAMQPHSVNQTARKLVDARFTRWLLRQSGTTDSEFQNRWKYLSKSPYELLRDLVRSAKKSSEIPNKAPILRTTGWRDPYNLFNSDKNETKEAIGAGKDLTDYLKELSDGAEIKIPPPPEHEKWDTILYNLLARPIVYQQACQKQEQEEEAPYVRSSTSWIKLYCPYIIRFQKKDNKIKKGEVGLIVSSGKQLKRGEVCAEISDEEQSGVKVEITVPFSGMVDEVFVKPGDKVLEGQPLACLKVNTDAVIRETAQLLREDKISPDMLYPFVRDTLDLHTHRLDAWITSLATRRLDAMRNKEPGGIHIGAYGWIENLKRDSKAQCTEPGGYIHAPSLSHASAGAVLRNAYLTHKDNKDGNLFRINLSSRRTRHGLRILQGIREGQELGALLGYHFERELHDSEMDKYIDPIRKCYPWDTPPAPAPGDPAKEVVSPRNVVNGLLLVREWTKKKSKVHKLIEEKADESELPEEVLSALSNLADTLDAIYDILMFESMYQQVNGNYEHCSAALDAMAGEGRPPEIESVQSPKAGTALGHRVCMLLNPCDPCGENKNNPRDNTEPTLSHWLKNIFGGMDQISCKVKWTEHSRSGDDRIKLLDLNSVSEEDLKKIGGIDDSLAAEIVTKRPDDGYEDFESIKEKVEDVTDEILKILEYHLYVTRPKTTIVTLADLNLGYLDFLHICSSMPLVGSDRKNTNASQSGDTELDRRIKYFFREKHKLSPQIEVDINYKKAKKNKYSISDALALGQCLNSLLSSSTMLLPTSLCRPEDSENKLTYINENLKERVESASRQLTKLKKELLALKKEDNADDVLLHLSKFGFADFIPDAPGLKLDEIELEDLKNAIVAKLQECNDCLSGGDDDFVKQTEQCINAARTLFGSDFILLPRVTAGNHEILADANKNKNVLPESLNEERVFLWLQQAALTHPNLMKLESAMMAVDGWKTDCGNQAFGSLDVKVLQLSDEDNIRWQALSDHELLLDLSRFEKERLQKKLQIEGRPRAVISMVALKDRSITFSIGGKEQAFCGLMFDQWTENIPNKTRTTGISFNYDRPNTQAPQALLLAVPNVFENKNKENPWTYDSLCEIVKDTIDLAKIRAVDLDALAKDLALGRFFPCMLLSGDINRWDFITASRKEIKVLFDDSDHVTPILPDG